MSFLRAISKGVRAISSPLLSIGRAAGSSPMMKAIPGVGTGLAVLGGAATISSMVGGGGSSGLPAIPGIGVQPGQTGGFGIPRGPGGGMQLPWNDPAIAEYLKAFSLDDSYLRTYVKAPKGYVVIKDAQGRPFAVLKTVAKHFKLWRPSAKPPISVRDWNHLKGASRTISKLKTIDKMARKVANYKSPQRRALPAPKKGK